MDYIIHERTRVNAYVDTSGGQEFTSCPSKYVTANNEVKTGQLKTHEKVQYSSLVYI